jgi:hypothetical protein
VTDSGDNEEDGHDQHGSFPCIPCFSTTSTLLLSQLPDKDRPEDLSLHPLLMFFFTNSSANIFLFSNLKFHLG